jgi:Na+/melibiose symporter-like transporter
MTDDKHDIIRIDSFASFLLFVIICIAMASPFFYQPFNDFVGGSVIYFSIICVVYVILALVREFAPDR